MIRLMLLILFIIVSLFLIVLILIQRSRGGGLAGAFGAGGGSETFLGAIQNKEIVRWTTYLAISFFVLSILLDMFPPERSVGGMDDLNIAPPSTQTAPAGPVEGSAPEGQAPSADGVPVTGDIPAAPAGNSETVPAGN